MRPSKTLRKLKDPTLWEIELSEQGGSQTPLQCKTFSAVVAWAPIRRAQDYPQSYTPGPKEGPNEAQLKVISNLFGPILGWGCMAGGSKKLHDHDANNKNYKHTYDIHLHTHIYIYRCTREREREIYIYIYAYIRRPLRVA